MGHVHTEEFKREAVRLAKTSGLTRKQVAIRFDWTRPASCGHEEMHRKETCPCRPVMCNLNCTRRALSLARNRARLP